MSRLSNNFRKILPDKSILSPTLRDKPGFAIKKFLRKMSEIYDSWSLAICFFFLVSSSFAEGVIPKIVSKLIDLRHDREGLKLELALFFGVICLAIVLAIGREYYQRAMGETVLKNLRVKAYNCFIEADLEFFDQNDIGSLLGRISNDTSKAETCVTEIMFEGLSHLVLFLTYFTLLLTVSAKMTLVLTIVIPISMYSSVHFSKIVKKLAKKYNKISAESQTYIEQRFSNILTVAAFHRQEAEIAGLEKFTLQAINNTKSKAFFNAANSIVNVFLPHLSMLVALIVGWWMVQGSELTFGDLTMFLMISRQTNKSALKICNKYSKVSSSLGSLYKFFKLLNYKPKIQLGVGLPVPPLTKFQIEFEGVGFNYANSDTYILKEVNLTIQSGEYVGVVGLSGSGKSSLLKLLLRLYDPTEGAILLDKTDIRQFQVEDYHKIMGYVSQEPILFSGTLEDNMLYGKRDATQEELEWALKMAGINFLQDFPKGLKTKIGDRGAKLSGGQKQRVCIARALIRRPKIIVFDEATSALDPQSELIVQKSIEQIVSQNRQNNLHLTVVVIAHQLSTLRMADRIVVMDKGKVVANGDHETVLRDSVIYRNLIHRYSEDGRQLFKKKSINESSSDALDSISQTISQSMNDDERKKSDEEDD